MFSVVFFIFFDSLKIHGAPLTRYLRIARDADDPFGYLTKYGYLSRSNIETGELRSGDEIVQAVRNLQRMAGLPQTGDLDDPKLKEIMSQPRCGMGDNRIRTDPNAPLAFNLAPTRWDNKKAITFKTVGYSRAYDHEQQRSDFHKAFNIWKEVADLEFVEVHPHEYADILLSFERWDHRDGYPFDGQGGTLAHAYPPGNYIGGDVHFDDDEPWSQMGEPGTISLYTAAAHEFGHSLGIQHSEVSDAIMFPWYKAYSENFKLHYDDVAAIQILYGPPRRVQDPLHPPVIATSLPTITTRPPTPPPREIPLPPRPGTDEAPNPCNTDIDAVASARGEVFAFKGKWFWRFSTQGTLMGGRPIKTSSFWGVLPENLERIDAATYIFRLDLTVYFSGDRYWTLKATDLYDTPPHGHHLTRLGLPAYLTKIDAALTWRFNDRTYLFTGYDYWRLDNTTRELRIEQGYPKAFDIWQGIPVPIDAALGNLADGSTYFFKGTQIYKFDDKNMTVDPRFPQDIGRMWLNCEYNMPFRVVSSNASGNSLHLLAPGVLTLAFFVLNLYCHEFC